MTTANQLFLLADHVKLSLLERKRAQSLNLEDDTQDGHISRSLEQFRNGLDGLREQRERLDNDDAAASSLSDSISNLQSQYDDLTAQFHGFTNPSTSTTLTHPNTSDPALASDFAHAASTSPDEARRSKTVRFTDTPGSPDVQDPTVQLFGSRYRDDPDEAGYRDEAEGLNNQQLHAYHAQILDQQDEQLDRLGESISRQRELSMQIGDELDEHVAMLDDVEAATDRHQSRLNRASKALDRVAKGASENKSMTTIIILIIILVLLIAVLK